MKKLLLLVLSGVLVQGLEGAAPGQQVKSLADGIEETKGDEGEVAAAVTSVPAEAEAGVDWQTFGQDFLRQHPELASQETGVAVPLAPGASDGAAVPAVATEGQSALRRLRGAQNSLGGAPADVVGVMAQYLPLEDKMRLRIALAKRSPKKLSEDISAEWSPLKSRLDALWERYGNKILFVSKVSYLDRTGNIVQDDMSASAVERRELLVDAKNIRYVLNKAPEGIHAVLMQVSSAWHFACYSALHCAVEDNRDGAVNGQFSGFIAALLAAVPKADLWEFMKMQNAAGNTALHSSIGRNMQISAVAALLAALPEDQRADFVRMKNRDDETALHDAASKGRADIVGALLMAVPQDGRADFVRMQNVFLSTALHKAYDYTQTSLSVDVVDILLNMVPAGQEQRDFVRMTDRRGNTALHLAAMRGFAEGVEVLLRAFKALNVPTRSFCDKILCLRRDAKNNYLCDFVQMKNSRGDTALHLAVKGFRVAFVKEFLKVVPRNLRVALVLMPDQKGKTALQLASEEGFQELADFLKAVVAADGVMPAE